MSAILRDLLRTSREFAIGATLTAIVAAVAIASLFSPYPPLDVYVVPPDVPPGEGFPLGTTSRGQDVFWQLAEATRNTLLFGLAVAAISRVIAITVGLLAGYLGGAVDRVL